MTQVQKLTTKDTFTKEGAFVPRGHPIMVDSDDLNGNERNLIDYDGSIERSVVEMAAVAPTGPNPTRPQQVPVNAVETIEGFVVPGAVLVGEVTASADERLDKSGISAENTGQSDIAAALMADADDTAAADKKVADAKRAADKKAAADAKKSD
jgi:hypothetical protein